MTRRARKCRHRGRARAGISGDQQGPHAASTSSRSPTMSCRDGADADGARRRRRAAAVHRLRQPGQPAAEPERVARAGVRHPRGDRRQPLEPDPSAAHRTALLVWTGGVLGPFPVRRSSLVSSASRPRIHHASTRSARRRRAVVHDAPRVPVRFCSRAAGTEGTGAAASDSIPVGPRLDPQNSLLRRSLLSGSGCRDVLLSIRLMVHTMLRLSRVDPGFDPHNLNGDVLAGRAGLADPRKQAFFAEAVERVRAVPGVENAALRIAPHPWLELVDRVHRGRQAPPAGAVLMDLPSAGMFR